MPISVTLEHLPAGIAMSSARGGEKVAVALTHFLSSEDGDLFIKALEGFPDQLLSLVPPKLRNAATVDNMLAVINKDKTATVYVNEIPIILKIRPKRSFLKGEHVSSDDVADIAGLEFGSEMSVPADAGVLFVFSIGWRKALFYDFSPLQKGEPARPFDLSKVLGSYYSYLSYQALFKVTGEEWEKLFNSGWFPFITLRQATRELLLRNIRHDWELDGVIPQIVKEILLDIDSMLERWKFHPLFEGHTELFSRAVEHFKAKDYLSATSLLYPRIEGLMRSIRSADDKTDQDSLANRVTKKAKETSIRFSPLLPSKFQEYLKRVYFRNFDPKAPLGVGRNTVGHGVAAQESFDAKAAAIGLLIADQICFFVQVNEERNKTGGLDGI